MEYTNDQIEIDCLNNFFYTNFESFWVGLIDNCYMKVIGIDADGKEVKLMWRETL